MGSGWPHSGCWPLTYLLRLDFQASWEGRGEGGGGRASWLESTGNSLPGLRALPFHLVMGVEETPAPTFPRGWASPVKGPAGRQVGCLHFGFIFEGIVMGLR